MPGHQPRPTRVLPPFDIARYAPRAVSEELECAINRTVLPIRGWHPLIPLPLTPRNEPTTVDCWIRSPIHLHQCVRCLALLFLTFIVLEVVGGRMQPRERQSQYGRGDGGGRENRRRVGRVVVVPPAPMADVEKPGRLVFNHRRGAPRRRRRRSRLRPGRPRTTVPPPA